MLIAAITAVTSSAVGSSGSAEHSAPAKAGAKLGPCPKHARPRRLRCGTIKVPYERADPSLGTTRVRFAVRRRGDTDAPAKRPIFAVEGGPGYGSIASARYYIHMFGPVLRRHDLVLVDMRGTGHSRAINCPKLQKGYGTDREGVAQCARILGDHYESYRTSAAADDIDDVRRTLGIGRIDLYGDSYGTFLAQSYAYRHGDSLAALVLDSAYPVRGESPWYPSLWRNGSGRCRSPATAPRRARATRTGGWAAWSRRCVGRPAGSGRCSTRSPPAATSPRCATSSRSTRRSAPTCTATAGPTGA